MLFRKQTVRSRFSRWIKLHHQALYKHALWMTGSQDLAADMVQEAFYQAWMSVNQLRDDEKALPWLLTILRRVIYREQRYQYRHQETVADLQHLDVSSNHDHEFALVEIYSCLGRISVSQREALLLHLLHGFTYEEISEQLKIPLGTVMSRIARAKEALQKLQNADREKIIDLRQIKQREKSK